MPYKEVQLDDILAKTNVKIAAISETKKKSKFSKEEFGISLWEVPRS
jgi:hypothetical protein